MVLFGVDSAVLVASGHALRAAAELDRRLQALRASLLAELGCATEHAICLHAGIATIGEIGDHALRSTIAVGTPIDAVMQLAAADDAHDPHQSGDNAARVVASRAIVRAARGDENACEWRALALPQGGSIEFTRLDAARAERCASRNPAR